MITDYNSCIDCGLCTKHCLFLNKYGLNLKEYAQAPALAYHCFLCGACTQVCPLQLDGRQLSMDLRAAALARGARLSLQGYAPLLLEKSNYLFKNYRNQGGRAAFFPGCNFPAYYPETTKLIGQRLRNTFGMGTIFDCCGKPIADLALQHTQAAIATRLEARCAALGVEELVTLCPNCYYYLREHSALQVRSLYEDPELMAAIRGPGAPVPPAPKGLLFLPCPDREAKTVLRMLEPYLDLSNLTVVQGIQCCGAGGGALVKEGVLAAELRHQFRELGHKVYFYCATCAGVVNKAHPQVEHLLCHLLGTGEAIAQGITTVKNRARFAWKNCTD